MNNSWRFESSRAHHFFEGANAPRSRRSGLVDIPTKVVSEAFWQILESSNLTSPKANHSVRCAVSQRPSGFTPVRSGARRSIRSHSIWMFIVTTPWPAIRRRQGAKPNWLPGRQRFSAEAGFLRPRVDSRTGGEIDLLSIRGQ